MFGILVGFSIFNNLYLILYFFVNILIDVSLGKDFILKLFLYCLNKKIFLIFLLIMLSILGFFIYL